MTDKEATVFVIDLGASMGRKNHDRAETDLDWAMKYVWDKVATMVGWHSESVSSCSYDMTRSRRVEKRSMQVSSASELMVGEVLQQTCSCYNINPRYVQRSSRGGGL